MTILWQESVPSNASVVGNAPVDFKSVWTAISTGMAKEHYWPGLGGSSNASAGELLPGASRAFSGTLSQSSAPNSQYTGRLFLDTSLGRLYAYDSAGTYLVGSAWNSQHSTSAVGLGYWARQSGSTAGIATGLGVVTINFPFSYATTPFVTITPSSSSWHIVVKQVTTSAAISAYSSFAGAASTLTIYWEALGIASLVSI